MQTKKIPFSPPQLDQYQVATWYEGFFSEEEVRIINQIYQKNQNKREAEVADEGYVKEDLRKSTVSFVSPSDDELFPFVQKLAQVAIQSNFHHYRFDLMGFHEDIQIAEYSEGDFFDWHADFGTGEASTRKLSLSVQLCHGDEYEGGDLEFQVNTDTVAAPRTLGTVVVFPSFALHRVTPITAGQRRSMVGWVTGVPFR